MRKFYCTECETETTPNDEGRCPMCGTGRVMLVGWDLDEKSTLQARITELEAEKASMELALKLKADEIKDLKAFAEIDRAENARLERIARGLWNIIDEIDTIDDIAKGDENLYRGLVRQEHKKRFLYGTTDGYALTFLPIEQLPVPTQQDADEMAFNKDAATLNKETEAGS